MTEFTVEELWRLFKATDDKMARLSDEAARRHAETEAAMARSRAETEAAIARSRAETDAAMARLGDETARSRAETEAALLRLEASSARERAKTEELFRRLEAERARDWAKTTDALLDLSRKMGKLSNRLGDFAEDMVAPAAARIFRDRGIPVHNVHRGVPADDGTDKTEFDLLVLNASHVLAIEVKSRPGTLDVETHLNRLDKFKRFFPNWRDRTVMGGIAGMAMDDEVARFAYRKGLYVLGQSGETVVILNDDKFRPRTW